MIYTFKGIRDEIFRLIDETSTNSPSLVSVIKDLVNQAHQQRCVEFPWTFMLWPRAQTFTTVIGQRRYALHQEFHRPVYFWNRTSKDYLEEVPFQSLANEGDDWNNTTGTARRFFYAGRQCVALQPSTDSPVTLVSSSGSDTGASYNVVVRGEDANGALRAELITPAGTSSMTGSITFRTLLGVTKAGSWNGTLTLSDSGATTLLTLSACELGRAYPLIEVVEAPTTAEVIEYRFYRQPLMLINDYDVPEIPAPHSQILVWDALVGLSAGYLQDVPTATVSVWREKQREAQMALYQALAVEGQTLNARPRFVRTILREPSEESRL
jgi:hypothetical protein